MTTLRGSTFAVERLRMVLLHALGAAAALPGCSERPVGEGSGDGAGSGESAAEASEPVVTTGGSEGSEGSGGSTEVDEVLACEPDPMAWCEQVLCMPKNGACAAECDQACKDSPEMMGVLQTCFVSCIWEVTTMCGPAQQDGRCCYVVHVEDIGCPGRPLRISEEVHVAPVVARADWRAEVVLAAETLAAPRRAEAAERWTRAAQDEHASIAAFARSALQLLGLGAPAELIAGTQAALADEVEHARLAFAVAGALGGAAVGPGALRVATERLATSAEEVALATFHEGCVGETIAAAIAGAAAERCADAGLRAVLRGIAEDELRHAALAWRCLRWLLARPETARVRATLAAARWEEVARSESAGDEVDAGLAVFGCLSRGEERRIAGEVWRSVVGPCVQALLRDRTGRDRRALAVDRAADRAV